MVVDYRDVSIHRTNIVTLKHIDFNVTEGEMVYVIGKVGSGKTSFLKSIYAELPLACGCANVLGYDLINIKRKDIPYLRRQLGIVFQDFRLLTDRDIYSNMSFVLDATGWKNKDELRQRIECTLKDVGLFKRQHKMPHELSGGEQQRAVLARALLNNPKLILADEPTGNLDNDTAQNVVARLKAISANGTSVIMATHNMGLVEKYPGRVFLCEDRKLTEIN